MTKKEAERLRVFLKAHPTKEYNYYCYFLTHDELGYMVRDRKSIVVDGDKVLFDGVSLRLNRIKKASIWASPKVPYGYKKAVYF